MEILSLEDLLEEGAIPEQLREVAAMEALAASDDFARLQVARDLVDSVQDESQRDKNLKVIKDLTELRRLLVSKAVVEPLLTPDEVRRMHPSDVQMVFDLLMRMRDTDEDGVRIGVVPVATFPDAGGGGEEGVARVEAGVGAAGGGGAAFEDADAGGYAGGV